MEIDFNTYKTNVAFQKQLDAYWKQLAEKRESITLKGTDIEHLHSALNLLNWNVLKQYNPVAFNYVERLYEKLDNIFHRDIDKQIKFEKERTPIRPVGRRLGVYILAPKQADMLIDFLQGYKDNMFEINEINHEELKIINEILSQDRGSFMLDFPKHIKLEDIFVNFLDPEMTPREYVQAELVDFIEDVNNLIEFYKYTQDLAETWRDLFGE